MRTRLYSGAKRANIVTVILSKKIFEKIFDTSFAILITGLIEVVLRPFMPCSLCLISEFVKVSLESSKKFKHEVLKHDRRRYMFISPNQSSYQ